VAHQRELARIHQRELELQAERDAIKHRETQAQAAKLAAARMAREKAAAERAKVEEERAKAEVCPIPSCTVPMRARICVPVSLSIL
jgi:septal ring factor EnvC (AmiA/AmiB activator)